MTRAVLQGLAAPDAAVEREIASRLNDVEAALEKAVRSDSDFVTEAASYLVNAGGKRFRPMLVLLSGYLGDPTDPRLVQGSVAVEVIHLATLYHDDVIDEAEFRRGLPSVNSRWDNTVAILTGDFLFAKASEIASDLGTDVTKLLARTIAILCDGQIRETEAAGRPETTVDAYMEIIRRKTAALIAASCRLGGMMSDASSEVIEALDDFGTALGMAFQLSDDIMDLTSSEAELKKIPGQDVKEGVYTLPVLVALHDPRRGAELRELLAGGPPDGERLARALEMVRSDGALGLARAEVSRHVRRAKDLAGGFADGPAREAFLHLADFLAARCGALA